MISTECANLQTKWEKKLSRTNPLNEYPRPQLVRDSYLSLNGEWDFAFSKSSEAPSEFSDKILVPFPPESRNSGIMKTPEDDEYLHYRRFFTLPKDFLGKRTVVHFGAVDQISTVYVNGKTVGKNEGGYIPFSFDITDYLTDGENELSLSVTDTLDIRYPYGKQTKRRGGMWYTPVSGIWQTVWLEALPENPIEKIRLTPDINGVDIELTTLAKNKTLTLLDSGESFTFTENKIRISPREIKLWTPESPHIYRFSLETETDRVESYFALREIGVAQINGVKRLTLNGSPYLFHGLLDQGYYPDGIFTPASYGAYREDILFAKSLGFNTLRKHIKIEPQIFYYLCDTLGMVVFQDMVNNSDYSFFRDTALPTVGIKRIPDKKLHSDRLSRQIFIDTAKKTLGLLYNSPSVLYYTVFNEGWGQFSADEVYRELKALDKTRIFDATSGWFWQKESDVDSHHVYFKKLKVRPHPNMPSVISEFGGYSYRAAGHLFGSKNYGYKTFGTVEELSLAIEKLYLNEVCPLVEKCVSALIYTQISDVEDETNGFLTYDRELVKLDDGLMQKIKYSLDKAFSKGVSTEK